MAYLLIVTLLLIAPAHAAEFIADKVVIPLTYSAGVPRERLEIGPTMLKYFRDTDLNDDFWFCRTQPGDSFNPYRDPVLGIAHIGRDTKCSGAVVLNGGAQATKVGDFSPGTNLAFQCRYWGNLPQYGGYGDNASNIWFQSRIAQYKNGVFCDGVVSYLHMKQSSSSPNISTHVARFWMNGTWNLYLTPDADDTGALGVLSGRIDPTGDASLQRRWNSIHVGTGASTFAGQVNPQTPAGASLGDAINKWNSLYACYVRPDCLTLSASDPASETGAYQLHIRPYGDGTVYLSVKSPSGAVYHFKAAQGAPTDVKDRIR
jgi:hypothetical protein